MVTHEEIRAIANLAKLQVPDEELDGLTEDMNEIIAFADTIASVQVEDEAYEDVNGLSNVLREDVVQPGLSAEEVLQNARDRDENSFVVKKHA